MHSNFNTFPFHFQFGSDGLCCHSFNASWRRYMWIRVDVCGATQYALVRSFRSNGGMFESRPKSVGVKTNYRRMSSGGSRAMSVKRRHQPSLTRRWIMKAEGWRLKDDTSSWKLFSFFFSLESRSSQLWSVNFPLLQGIVFRWVVFPLSTYSLTLHFSAYPRDAINRISLDRNREIPHNG